MICRVCNIDKQESDFNDAPFKDKIYKRRECKKCQHDRYILKGYKRSKKTIKKYHEKSVSELKNHYVYSLLSKSDMPVTEEFMEVRKQLIILKRKISEHKKTIK